MEALLDGSFLVTRPREKMVLTMLRLFAPLILLLLRSMFSFRASRRVKVGGRGDTPAQVQDRQKPGSGLLSAQRASVRLHFQPRSREK